MCWAFVKVIYVYYLLEQTYEVFTTILSILW